MAWIVRLVVRERACARACLRAAMMSQRDEDLHHATEMAAELRKAVEDGIAAVDGDAPEVACREALERIAAGIKHARGGVIGDDAGDASLADGSDHRDDDGTGAAPAAAVAEAGASVDAAVAVEAVAVEAVAMASPVDAVADGAAVSVTDAVVVDAVVTLDGESLSSSPPWLERVRLFQEHQEQVQQFVKAVAAIRDQRHKSSTTPNTTRRRYPNSEDSTTSSSPSIKTNSFGRKNTFRMPRFDGCAVVEMAPTGNDGLHNIDEFDDVISVQPGMSMDQLFAAVVER